MAGSCEHSYLPAERHSAPLAGVSEFLTPVISIPAPYSRDPELKFPQLLKVNFGIGSHTNQ
jgi:hypothetical protein